MTQMNSTFATVNISKLKNAVNSAAKAVLKNPSIDLLQYLLFEINDRNLEITGYDTEKRITATIAALESQPGRFAIAPTELKKWLSKAPKSGVISILHDPNKNTVTLKAAKASINFAVKSEVDFPNLKAGKLEASFGLEAQQLNAAIKSLLPCLLKSDTDYRKTSIHLKSIGDSELLVQSSDGSQVAQVILNIPSGIIFDALVAPELFDDLRLFSGQFVNLDVVEHFITLDLGDIRKAYRRIKGKYFDLPRLNASSQIVIDKAELLNQLEIACAFQEHSPVRLITNKKQQKLQIAADFPEDDKQRHQGGNLRVEVPCAIERTGDLHVDATKLRDLIKSHKSSDAVLDLNAKFESFNFKLLAILGDGITHALMPLEMKNPIQWQELNKGEPQPTAAATQKADQPKQLDRLVGGLYISEAFSDRPQLRPALRRLWSQKYPRCRPKIAACA
jgi:DNA polymerase III sliding clamp (beta) subunit (PCNA family)